MQSQLNQQAIEMLPLIKTAIDSANDFDANQMGCYTIKSCLSTTPCLDNKTPEQLLEFQKGLISHFKFSGWMASTFEVLWYAQRGFSNEGTYLYGSAEDLQVFYDKNATADNSFTVTSQHRTLEAAKNSAIKALKTSKASYKRQRMDYFLDYAEVNHYQENEIPE